MATTLLVSRRSFLSAAPAALAGATAAVPLAALADVNSDAELLRLDRAHDVAFARAAALDTSTDPLGNDEVNEICEAHTDLEFTIQDIPAQTWAGVVVKARIAAKYVEQWRGMDVMDAILPSLIDNILRIANVTAKRVSPHAVDQGSNHGAV